jgi:hypothetical protein
MRTVAVWRTFDYRPDPRITVRFFAGTIYRRVIEAAARAIEDADAGAIVEHTTVTTQDASDAWRRRW